MLVWWFSDYSLQNHSESGVELGGGHALVLVEGGPCTAAALPAPHLSAVGGLLWEQAVFSNAGHLLAIHIADVGGLYLRVTVFIVFGR